MKKFLILGLSLALLAGCTSLKRVTGQIDDTVLPGQRQEILPPDQQQARDPNVVGNQGTAAATPGAPVTGQPNVPPAHAVASGPVCDSKVDLCPETASPEPLPPPSPVIPEKPKTAMTGKTTSKTASAAKSNTAKTAATATTAGSAATGTGAAVTDGTTKTADATVAKKKKKKKPVAPADATAAPATNDSTPPVPSAPQPDAQ